MEKRVDAPQRPLDAQERAQAQRSWPRMAVANVVVTDEPTPVYNCLAWTLGIATSWVWPWGSGQPSINDFNAFYRTHGFNPATDGPIAGFGLGTGPMKHGSISGPAHGPRWESKCGEWLRIQHGLQEMGGGAVYGDVRQFYSHILRRPRDVVEALKKMVALSDEEITFVRQRAARVADDVRGSFEQAYEAWRSTWKHPLVMVSSSPADRAMSIEFLELVALGPDILPLLMEKLLEAEQFFALVAIDRLAPASLVVVRDLEDESFLLGEQGRARETLKRWIASEA